MKAKISDEIAKLCVDDKVEFYHITRGGGWEGLFKKDVFYSFNGDAPLKPKNIVRERTEAKITEGEFLDIIHGGYIQIGDMKNFITVKRKNTDCNGVEMNEEYKAPLKQEGLLTRDARIKERKKYGRKRARKRFQFSKR